jgi:hypothetical protein
MALVPSKPAARSVVVVRLLGRFAVEAGGGRSGAWPSPGAVTSPRPLLALEPIVVLDPPPGLELRAFPVDTA